MKIYLIFVCLLMALFSCSEKMFVADAAFEQKHFPFIADQKTTREEIILKLGEPSWSFEKGRILTYRIAIDKRGNVNPVRVTNNKSDPYFSYMSYIATKYYSLVLVFSGNNVLQQHSLLLTNP